VTKKLHSRSAVARQARRRQRRLALRVTGALLLFTAMVATAVTGGAARRHTRAAAAGAGLGSYTLTATAPGVEFTEDNPGAQAHPEGQGAVPYTTTNLMPGPIGYGLSSVFWPGALVANAGGIVGLLAPHDVNGVPIPDAVTGALYPQLSLANYPVRAEARTGGASPDASYEVPGTTLKAHADSNKVTAIAQVNGAEQPGQATFGSMHSESSSTLSADASSGAASATSTINNLSFGAGVIKIGSVTSTANATTDGAKSTANGGTSISDVTVAGQRAYFDETGLHIGDQNQPANAIANQIAQQALSGAGFETYVSAPLTEVKGAKATYTAGSVYIVWKPPGSTETMTWSLGGARVSVDSGPGFDVAGLTGGGQPLDTGSFSAAPVASAPTSSGPSAPAGATTAAGASDLSAAPVAAESAGTAPASAATGGAGSTLPTQPAAASGFGGIPAGWAVVALAGAGLCAAGFKRVTDDVLERAATACPLER
jgi:hypothetical protein